MFTRVAEARRVGELAPLIIHGIFRKAFLLSLDIEEVPTCCNESPSSN